MKRLLCIILTSLLLSTSVRAAADFVSFAGRPPCRHGQSLRSDHSSHRRQKSPIAKKIVVEQIVVNPDNSHYSYFGANR